MKVIEIDVVYNVEKIKENWFKYSFRSAYIEDSYIKTGIINTVECDNHIRFMEYLENSHHSFFNTDKNKVWYKITEFCLRSDL